VGVWVEESGSEDADVFGVKDRLREAREELARVLRKEGEAERVDAELGFVGGEAKGQPGRVSHRERLVELGNDSEGGVFFYFLFFIFYIIYSLLRYKKSHGALAMAKTKPKIQNEQTKEKSGTNLFNWGPYRSQAHTRA